MTNVVEESFGKNPIINESLECNASSEISIEAIETNPSKQEIPGDGNKAIQKRAFWNLFVFSLSYFLLFTGFWTLSTLQSTMNALEGIGDYSQAVIYVCSTVSCILLPTFVIGKFGCKNILMVGAVTCVLCMASNMFLRWDTLMVGAVLYGVANGPFIASQAFYIDEMATRFQTTVEGQSEFIMALFFGLFMFFGQSTQIWGNLISYYVLRSDRPAPSPLNSTDCGINFRPSVNDTNKNLDPPTENQRFLLVGIYVAMGCVAIFVLGIFLEPLKNDLRETKGCRTILDRLLSSFKFLRDPVRILLIPLSVYIGMEGPFYTNEVTQAYIACSWGVHHVGFVTVCFGVCGALMSLLVGPLVKCISQMAVLVLAACANVAICIVLYLWQPSPDFPPAYFIIAGVWGMGDAIWWSQVTALYGLMFPNDREAAFSNLYFWSFLGFFLSYSYANYFTVAVKINILLCFLVTGMIGYLIGQIKIKCAPAVTDYVTIPNSEDE